MDGEDGENGLLAVHWSRHLVRLFLFQALASISFGISWWGLCRIDPNTAFAIFIELTDIPGQRSPTFETLTYRSVTIPLPAAA